MGSSHRRRLAGPVLVAAVAAGGCLIALADSPTATAPVPPTVATATPAGAAAGTPSTAPSTQPSPPTHLVKTGKLSFTVNGEGVFVADDPYELRLKLNRHAGELKISAVAANRASVKKGDVLLEIDPFSINNEVTSAENEVAAARATLTKAEADAELGEKGDALAMRIQDQETKNAEAAVRWWEKVDGPHMLAQTELQVKLSKANVEDQDDELEQLRKMYKSEELTTATADIVVKRALRQLEIAKLSSQISEERAEKVEAHTYPITKQSQTDALEQSRQRLAMLKVTQAHAAVLRKTALSGAKLAAAQAEKKLADLKKDQELFSVKSPADGVVMYGYASAGAWVGADPKTMKVGEKLSSGQTVLTVFSPGDLKIEMTLPESQTAWVKEGTKADVKPVAYPELNYDGKCAEPAVKPGTSGLGFYTTIALSGVDARVVPGMKSNVRIAGGDVDGILLVPTAAVVNGKAWVRKDGQETEREVTTGRSDAKMIEVVKGLAEGDEILREGEEVIASIRFAAALTVVLSLAGCAGNGKGTAPGAGRASASAPSSRAVASSQPTTKTAAFKPAGLPTYKTTGPYAESIRRGVEYLVSTQQPDGSWGTGLETRGYEVYHSVPGTHDGMRVATTALCVMALREAGEKTAHDKGLKYLVAHGEARRDHASLLYNIWAHQYALQALSLELQLKPEQQAVPADQIRKAAEWQLDRLVRYEVYLGGWNYYDFESHTQKPSMQATSFGTASGLVALWEAKRAGIDVPEKLSGRAFRRLEEMRLPNGAYLYSGDMRFSPRHPANFVRGSVGRTQACNDALWLFGSKKVGEPEIRDGLDMFFREHIYIDMGRQRQYPHEAWYMTAPYYYYFGHYYTARLLERLGPAATEKYGPQLAETIVPHQESDGSWWDYAMWDYHKPYGTAFSVMTLLRCH